LRKLEVYSLGFLTLLQLQKAFSFEAEKEKQKLQINCGENK
jgi:hypothetical protein